MKLVKAQHKQLLQGVSSAGLLINTDYTNGAYTPGIFWHTGNDNSTKPKAGIYLKETSTGTYMYFGTSNSFTTGITNNGLLITPSGTLQSSYGSASTPTYSFTGTTNTGILNFTTNGSERMRMFSDGNISIGASYEQSNSKVFIYQTTGSAGLRVQNTYTPDETAIYNFVSMVNGSLVKSISSQYNGDKFTVWGDGRTNISGGDNIAYMLAVYGTA
ncbi:MAG: hypothetical protein Fur0028_08200 [Bacteroidales bacterium]